ncbi:hypothetical protein [Ruania alba]|nr:hypothetical protein [Ruania alba]
MNQQQPSQPNQQFGTPQQYGAPQPPGAQEHGAPQPYGGPASPARTGRNTAGMLALAFGLICLAITVLAQMVWSFLPGVLYGSAIERAFNIGYDVLVLGTSVTACILGAIGLRRSTLPQRAAAVGLGLGLAGFGPNVIYALGRLLHSVLSQF